jgi:lipopolysaccharide transport system ATP-binding protein
MDGAAGMSAVAVRVDGLGKGYAMPDRTAFWALRNASFEVRRGEVLGIIGRNGAGKSTLLKILAGIVAPTTGEAELAGRVGSLLEVGTGFHPDLSGRENLFLAAALLGIPSAELKREFDRIVAYSGVGDFIDVPVKRYSSGMYMRLAYSVTSLLRSDILLLDEVLAVGDADFQKKTTQNVDAIAHAGRTVLFVSHSMSSVKNLCSRCIWLDHGAIVADGPPEQVVDSYLTTLAAAASGDERLDILHAPPRVEVGAREGYYAFTRSSPCIQWIETMREDGTPSRLFRTGDTLRVRVGFNRADDPLDYFGISFHTMDDVRVTGAYSHGRSGAVRFDASGVAECVIPDIRLVGGDYSIVVECGRITDGQSMPIDSVADATQIRVLLADYLGYPGVIRNSGHIAQRSLWQDLKGA